MKTKYLLVSSLVILCIVFLGLQLMQYEMYASFVRAAMVILLTILYRHQLKTKPSYFYKFLLTFAIAEVIGLLYWYFISIPEYKIDYIYFICNGLYILSYIFLIIMVVKSMNIRNVITKLPAHIVILVILDIFCVTIVTDTALEDKSIYQYALEFLYNAVIMTLLTFSVINYIYKVDKRAMNLLLGSIFIVFSEMIQLAYYYVLDINVLNVFCSLFIVLAFFFFYLQATLTETEEYSNFREHLEA